MYNMEMVMECRWVKIGLKQIGWKGIMSQESRWKEGRCSPHIGLSSHCRVGQINRVGRKMQAKVVQISRVGWNI